MGVNATEINELMNELGKAIQHKDLAWFKESVEQARSMDVLANIFSPLMVRKVAKRGSAEMLKIMLENGADANSPRKDGKLLCI